MLPSYWMGEIENWVLRSSRILRHEKVAEATTLGENSFDRSLSSYLFPPALSQSSPSPSSLSSQYCLPASSFFYPSYPSYPSSASCEVEAPFASVAIPDDHLSFLFAFRVCVAMGVFCGVFLAARALKSANPNLDIIKLFQSSYGSLVSHQFGLSIFYVSRPLLVRPNYAHTTWIASFSHALALRLRMCKTKRKSMCLECDSLSSVTQTLPTYACAHVCIYFFILSCSSIPISKFYLHAFMCSNIKSRCALRVCSSQTIFVFFKQKV